MIYKSGFVSIIGFPNVGKSTLMNSIIGEKISIITHKPQTTRHRILGIFNKYNLQIVFSDTPGLISHNKNFLQKKMMKYVIRSFEDADIILLLTEVGKIKNLLETERLKKILMNFIKQINNKIPIIVLINKIDKIKSNFNILYKTIDYWSNILPQSEILPISALKKTNQDLLIDKIKVLLSEHEPFYPKELLSDRSKRFFVNEIIRERVFFLYKREIPYSVEIKTEIFKQKEKYIEISSILYVERDSQKNILIGYSGKSLKRLKFFSIKKIEEFFQKKIILFLFVKICKNWRNNYKYLKYFGY
ncbi:GTPase Era [Blattabacterium cuenoti]|uniref:GTPase Era n=1 Tax=Blattabacterium cuenoti TaxID=1653831 RepID=UPI00163B7B3F|nr:GTPase Era [Blattabacterium cuenoti]